MDTFFIEEDKYELSYE